MPELHIRNQAAHVLLEPFLQEFAKTWECELVPLEDRYVLYPEVMLRKHGLFLFKLADGYKVCREEDATTWEDFLLMRLAHLLADRGRGRLQLNGEGEPLEVEPHRFATFDDYVDKVLEYEDDLVRDMKKYWIYAHRKRSIR
ncbi:hypothetical protein [Paenibacillus contaminans]|uniref:Uncharacterized protein n=1 Tax=Paenibacillus contaminans TaxID=450362 RepID=A0A329MLR2_9BACL|nr:hypothetical protein [Paenibacillus contaminans]RAV20236.1 hypothetical protein DQG23_17395 [Paenibacillus contaminans]